MGRMGWYGQDTADVEQQLALLRAARAPYPDRSSDRADELTGQIAVLTWYANPGSRAYYSSSTDPARDDRVLQAELIAAGTTLLGAGGALPRYRGGYEAVRWLLQLRGPLIEPAGHVV